VAALNHQLGTDRPVSVQYFDWLMHALRGDFGNSLALNAPVAPFLRDALANSAALVAVAVAVVMLPIGHLLVARHLNLSEQAEQIATKVGGLLIATIGIQLMLGGITRYFEL